MFDRSEPLTIHGVTSQAKAAGRHLHGNKYFETLEALAYLLAHPGSEQLAEALRRASSTAAPAVLQGLPDYLMVAASREADDFNRFLGDMAEAIRATDQPFEWKATVTAKTGKTGKRSVLPGIRKGKAEGAQNGS